MVEFKYIGIRDNINNIRNNAINEISAKKGLNKLNEIKNVEIIKHKKFTSKQKELLNLFKDLLDVILTDETLMSSKNENKKENENKNESENENDKILMSSNEDDDENENEDDDETMSQNEKNIRIKNINDNLDEIINKSKSFKDQIKSIKKVESLGEYYFSNDFGDKELKFKYLHTCQISLTKNYLNKYLVINLKH